MTWIEFSVRLGVALVLGGMIGLERQWRKPRSVLKTNALVCIGSAMFVMVSVMTPGDSSPTRIAAQVVSGVGFLGGGVILRDGASIRGLNTAATIWCSAAIGTMVGAGLMFQAYLGTFVVVIANLLLSPLVEQVRYRAPLVQKQPTRYRCSVTCYSKDEFRVRSLLIQALNHQALMLDVLQSRDIDGPAETGITEIKADLVMAGRDDSILEQVVDLLKTEGRVNMVSWQVVVDNSQSLKVHNTP
jgi:putative Mg2+ transporter-C (MgtC) family protein